MGAPPISQSEEFRHRPGSGMDLTIPKDAPNDTLRHWVDGDPFPRIVIDTAKFTIKVGDGTVEPIADLGSGSSAPVASEITIAATGPFLVIDPAGAGVIDATMDQNTVVTALPTPAGAFETKLILRGPFTPTFGSEFRFTNAPRPSSALQTDVEYNIETHNRSASLRVISYPFEAGTPDAPPIVTAASTGATTAHIAWLAPARNGGSAITGYKVTVRKTSDQSLVGIVHTVAAGTLFFDVTGLTAATSYDVEVYAQNAIGDSGKRFATVIPSGTATVPSIVRNLVAVPGVNKITVTYSDPFTDGGSALTGFEGLIASAGNSLTTPTVVQSTSTTTRVPVLAGTPLQWTAWRTSAAGDVAQSNALTTGPTAGNTLIALITHGSNGQSIASVPSGWAPLPSARGMDTTGAIDGSGGADTMCEIWYKVSDGTETGALTWTYVGNDTVYKVQVLEVPGLGSLLGGSGTNSSGMFVHQVAFASPAASTHNCGASPTLDPTKNYFALALFNGTNNDSLTFDSTYTEHAPASQTQHVATKLIPAGATGTTSTTASGGVQNVASCMLVWEVLPAGQQLTLTYPATTPGTKQIVTVHHTTAGRTTTGPAGWIQIASMETTDTHCHLEFWRRNTPGGETTASWIISGADLPAKLTYKEWAGVGAGDPTVTLFPAPAIATKTYDLGLSGTIVDKALMVIAATLDVNETVTFPATWVPDFETGTDMAHVGHLVKSGAGTTHPVLNWTAANANGIAAMLVFDPAPAGYSTTIPVGPSVHTIDFTGAGPGSTLVAGLSHTINVHAVNAVSPFNGPDATVVATPLSAIIPGVGGITALRLAMGTSAQSPSDVTATTNYWNQFAAPVNTPIGWAWPSHTGTDTGNAADTMPPPPNSTNGYTLLLADSAFPGAPVVVQRIGQYDGGQYTLAQINAGIADAHIDAYGVLLQQITTAQGGVPQWIRPLSEADGTWQAWKIDPNNVTAFTTAFRRIVSRVKAKCPTIKVTLTFDFGWGGKEVDGSGNRILNHSHSMWDPVMADLGGKYFGGLIDCVDIDAYSDGTPKVDPNTNLDLNGVPYNVNGHTWLYNEQQMYLARCIAWGVQIGNSEWGIGDRGGVVPAARGGIFYNADEYALAWCNFWISAPASGSGPIPIPGSLGHIELFDGSVYQGVLPDGRGVIHVPDPVGNPDGIRAASTIKTFLA